MAVDKRRKDLVRSWLKRPNVALMLLLLLYFVLGIGLALTKAPICDEGWYADPAFNLVHNGNMGSPALEGTADFLKNIGRYTYYAMPIHILVQAGIYEVFGASLLSMRAVSLLAGMAVLLCWYQITWKLSKKASLALLVVLLTELDTTFMSLSATGRSDMLSVAFGAAAQAVYLALREPRLRLAILISHSLVVASGLTHPLGGLMSLGAVLVLQFYLDRSRLVLFSFVLMAVPYVVGSLCWGAYILQDPAAFWSQFSGNSGQRLWPFKSPLLAIRREVVDRFLGGFRNGSSSWTPLANLRLLVLLAYLGSVCCVATYSKLRTTALAKILLAELSLGLVILLFFEGLKQPWYLIHITWPLVAILALVGQWYWTSRSGGRMIVGTLLAGIAFIEIGYPTLLVIRNAYRTTYLPAVSALSRSSNVNHSVMGSAELGFGLGFEKVIDDHNFGYYTHVQPPFIVVDSNYRGFLERYRREKPQVYRYAVALLNQEYRLAYANKQYRIYVHLN